MAEFDLFELAKIPFIYTKTDGKEHENAVAAIKKKIKDINGDINSGDKSRMPQRDFLKSLLTDDEKSFKDVQTYENLKKEKTAEVTEVFKTMVKSMKKQTVTEQFVKSFSDSMGLPDQTIRDILKSFGFVIFVFTEKMPEFPINAKMVEIEKGLDELRDSKDKNGNLRFPEFSRVSDLYYFTAHLNGNIDDAEDFRKKTFNELNNILTTFAKNNPGHQASPKDIQVRIASNASTSCFDSKENKEKYDNYVKYNSPKMTEIKEKIKKMPAELIKNPNFADNIIIEIEQIFKEDGQALTIYNKEAGILKKDPYVPTTIQYHVKCGSCGDILSFSTIQEANSVQTCTRENCKKPLYQPCRRCKNKVLVALDKCPECGFVFASTAEFAKYMAKAEESLRKGNFEEARQNLAGAKAADPGEKTSVSELEKKINADEAKFQEPLNKLRKLCAEKKYQEASELIVEVIQKYQGLNVSSFEADIKAAKTKAQTAFDSVKNQDVSEKVEVCINILNYFADFKPAIDYLKTAQPQAVKNINLDISKENVVTVNWVRSQEKGVLYCVIRKTGKNIPMNEKDGDLLKDNITDTFYNDDSISPGAHYSYAVIAKRVTDNKAVYSLPLGSTIPFIPDVTNISCEQIGTTIRITWKLPKNSLGATVSRIENGKELALSDNAQSNYEEKNIEYGKTYIYTLKTNYHDMPSSKGVRLDSITPSEKIDPFKISVENIKDAKYKIKWNIDRKNIELRVLINNKTFPGYKSNSNECEIEIQKNDFYIIQVEALSGGKWLLSQNSVEINTYLPCEIDKSTLLKEKVKEGKNGIVYEVELPIKIAGVIPNNAVEFIYCVRSKSSPDKPAPWATEAEISNAQDARKVSIESYRKNNGIPYTEIAKDEDAYYVTFFTVYNVNGKKVISAPYKKRYGRELKVNIFWKITKSLFGKGNLYIEAEGNYPFNRLPKFSLYADGRELENISDQTLASYYKKYQTTIEIDSGKLSSIDKNSKISLSEAEDDPVEGEEFTFRWAKGFSGKI